MKLRWAVALTLAVTAATAVAQGPAKTRDERREAHAREYLRTAHLANIHDPTTELRLEGRLPGESSTRFSYRQLYRGIPVTSGILVLVGNDSGPVAIEKDTTVADFANLDTKPVISAAYAKDRAVSQLQVKPSSEPEAELFVYPKGPDNNHHRLVWIVDVNYEDQVEHADNASVWVDAHDGSIVKSYTAERHSFQKQAETDAATKTSAFFAGWMKPQFFGDDGDESVLKAATKTLQAAMEDGCHGIFGDGNCPPTTSGIPGDSYWNCQGNATPKNKVLFLSSTQQYFSDGVDRWTFGNYLHDNSDPATAAADVWVAMKQIRNFMSLYLTRKTIQLNDAPTNVLVNENDPSTAPGGASYSLSPLPPKTPTTFAIVCQIGGVGPNGIPMTTGSAPDVVAHEIGHAIQWQEYLGAGGVTSANGPLQEAQADILASAFDSFMTSPGWPVNPWWIGEQECLTNYVGNKYTAPAKVAIRYMDHPSQDGYRNSSGQWVSSPDCYDATLIAGLDAHRASGPYNHMYYVLVTGDTTNTCNPSVSITAIGWEAGLQLWNVVVKTEHPSDSYAQLRQRWLDAATSLFGSGSGIATAVNAACDSVLIP